MKHKILIGILLVVFLSGCEFDDYAEAEETYFDNSVCDSIEVYEISDNAWTALFKASQKSGYVTNGLAGIRELDNGTIVENWARICVREKV